MVASEFKERPSILAKTFSLTRHQTRLRSIKILLENNARN